MLAAVLKHETPVALTQTLYPLVAVVLEEELMMLSFCPRINRAYSEFALINLQKNT